MLLIEPLPKINMVRLHVEYRFYFNGVFYDIPAGFVWDGFSNPKLFHNLLPSSFEPVVLEPSLPHDYFYRTHEVERELADELLRKMLLHNGVDEGVCSTVFNVVRACGGPSWNEAVNKPLVGTWNLETMKG